MHKENFGPAGTPGTLEQVLDRLACARTMRTVIFVCIAAFLFDVVAGQDVARLLAKYKDANQARREWLKHLHPNGMSCIVETSSRLT
jgi:hypothetical protein